MSNCGDKDVKNCQTLKRQQGKRYRRLAGSWAAVSVPGLQRVGKNNGTRLVSNCASSWASAVRFHALVVFFFLCLRSPLD